MVRSVVRYAKLRGLLATFAAAPGGGLRMEASGPLALFRHTLKYGHALAGFFPVLVSTPSYRLDALCTVMGGVREVVVRAGDPVPRTYAIPRDADSAIERALERDVRRLGIWSIERETEVVRAGHRLFFPDFTLTRGADRVLVEIVGYHTREYLERKSEALRAAADRKLIVCVEESLDCGNGAAMGGTVLFFRRRVNAERLLHAADALIRK
jgi:predicted nuclease of restriction endonuclease-like RecB superfamily